MYRPKELQEQLGVSAATLRRWSDTFADHLSPTAGKSLTDSGGASQRRYTDHDVLILARVKQLLDDGNTYEEAARRLQDGPGATETLPAVQSPTQPLMSDAAIALWQPQFVDLLRQMEERQQQALVAMEERQKRVMRDLLAEYSAAHAEELQRVREAILAIPPEVREELSKSDDGRILQRLFRPPGEAVQAMIDWFRGERMISSK